MLAVAIGKPAPPISVVLFNLFLLLIFAEAEPKERSLPMFFVLGETSDINISISVDFAAVARFLVENKLSFVELALLVD